MNAGVARSAIAIARENGIALVSAGLAFHMFNSLIPFLLFVIIGVTTFGWAESLLVTLEPVLGSDADSVLSIMDTVIGDGAGRRRAAVLAAGILAWSSFTMFQSVNRAFGYVYGVQAERSMVKTALNTCLILTTVILTIALVVGIHVGLTVVMGSAAATAVSIPLLGVALFGVFVPMFYQFPPSPVTIREALPGAVLTAVSWTACTLGFRVYLTTSESVQLYGVAGGVMLLLTGLYVVSVALLFGVILNAVLADRVEVDDRWTVGS